MKIRSDFHHNRSDFFKTGATAILTTCSALVELFDVHIEMEPSVPVIKIS